MTILISMAGYDPARWIEAFRVHAPDRRIVTEPAVPGDPSIRYAVVWMPPEGLLSKLPHLDAIFSLGAGVDHILRDGTLPDAQVVRVVSDDLTNRMNEYVVWRVLDHFRRGNDYRMQQATALWNERMQPAAHEMTVGIMGLGTLGRSAAEKLKVLGFKLVGWSKSGKRVKGVSCFSGKAGLDPFLALADIFVVLLPSTPETKGILSAPLFEKMKRRTPLGSGPVLINAGRGSLQVEDDILAALDSERLSEASLDVFESEPLPSASRLWKHPRVFVTPHAAAVSEPGALVPLMVAQMEAFERGEPLKHVVDRGAGY